MAEEGTATPESAPSSLPAQVVSPARSVRSTSSVRSHVSHRLGADWRKYRSKKSGDVYYHNSTTKESVWLKDIYKHLAITDWKATPGSSAGSVRGTKRVHAREEHESEKHKRSSLPSTAPALLLSPPRVPVIPLSFQGTPSRPEPMDTYGPVPDFSFVLPSSTVPEEPMEIDSVTEIKNLRREKATFSNEPSTAAAMMGNEVNSGVKGSGVLCLVVDTNVLIDDLNFLNKFRKPELYPKDTVQKVVCVVPWIVICELDKLKDYGRRSTNDKQLSLSAKASNAISYVRSELQRSAGQSPLFCQSLTSHNAQITCIQPETNDQHVIKCAVQMQKIMVEHRNTSSAVVLLTNDSGLRLQADVFNPSVRNVNTVPLRTHSTKELTRSLNLGRSVSPVPRRFDSPETKSDLVLVCDTETTTSNTAWTSGDKSLHLYHNAYKEIENALYAVLKTEMFQKMGEPWKNQLRPALPLEPKKPTMAQIIKYFTKYWLVFENVFQHKDTGQFELERNTLAKDLKDSPGRIYDKLPNIVPRLTGLFLNCLPHSRNYPKYKTEVDRARAAVAKAMEVKRSAPLSQLNKDKQLVIDQFLEVKSELTRRTVSLAAKLDWSSEFLAHVITEIAEPYTEFEATAMVLELLEKQVQDFGATLQKLLSHEKEDQRKDLETLTNCWQEMSDLRAKMGMQKPQGRNPIALLQQSLKEYEYRNQMQQAAQRCFELLNEAKAMGRG